MLAPSPLARLYHDRDRSVATLAIVPVRWRHAVVEADVTDEHVAGLMVWFGAGLVFVMLAGFLFGGWFLLLAITVVVAVPSSVFARWRGRRLRRLVASLPLVVDMVGRSLRSGASFPQALGEAKDDAPLVAQRELGHVLAEISLGRTAAQSLRGWADRNNHAEIRIVAAALALASENESGTSQALAGVSQSLRDRAALRAEIRAHAAQAVASMHALVVLPVAFFVVDVLGEQGTVRFLVGEPIGRLCLAGGIVLDVTGWAWMRLLVRTRMPT